VNVIPKPAKVDPSPGSFRLTAETEVLFQADSPEAKPVAEFLAEKLAGLFGARRLPRALAPVNDAEDSIVLAIAGTAVEPGDEGYDLLIEPSRVLLRARNAAGLFYGAQTLCQLLHARIEGNQTNHLSPDPGPIAIELSAFRSHTHNPTLGAESKSMSRNATHAGPGGFSLPCGHITDQPRFKWRGLLIDCSRTFQTTACLKRYIDLLAFHKMNVLHLHLTDDQGWRMEIQSHPELTLFGSQFEEKYHDSVGYYTQNDLRELLAYATERHVLLVPEIEMPGHCLAALKAHPELSCTGGPFEIYPFFKGPPIQENVFCAGNARVFDLLEEVLAEVIAIFPSPFIHIGGDEVPKVNWQKCPKCQARLKAEGLKNEDELQSYFIRRMAKFLASRNRRLIGWDEIMDGGLAEGAAVMSWRGMEAGIEAIRRGHDVVFSPTSHCYFDYGYSHISLEKTYSFEPMLEGLSPEQTPHILGVQANMWTHLARSDDALDEQVFPRLVALAEVGWSPRSGRDWRDFSERMETHYERLDRLGVKYKRMDQG